MSLLKRLGGAPQPNDGGTPASPTVGTPTACRIARLR